MKAKLTYWGILALIFLWAMIGIICMMGCATAKPTPTGQYKVIKIVAKDKDGNAETKYIGLIK